MPTLSATDRARGCLLAGAAGDALGAPVEFLSLDEIRARFGEGGIADLAPAYGRTGAITDDTQMSMFTAEGLIRAHTRGVLKGISHAASVVDHAYARWLRTQGEQSIRWTEAAPDGWLATLEALDHRRGPGATCLSALAGPTAGTVEQPLNDRKGCGGLMRIAPVGLTSARDPFALGCDLAALTHGHPSGYLSAGVLAEIIARVCAGDRLCTALDRVAVRLADQAGHEETSDALRAARALASSGQAPSAATVATLGEGWVAEEALAIAVYCALVAEDLEHGVRLAVNHAGDSDSTGAIAGNLLGVLHGPDAIPDRWLARLELREEIERLADDLVACLGPAPTADVTSSAWWERYPGW